MRPSIQAVPFTYTEAQNVFNMKHVITTDTSAWETVMVRRLMKDYPSFDVFIVLYDEAKVSEASLKKEQTEIVPSG